VRGEAKQESLHTDLRGRSQARIAADLQNMPNGIAGAALLRCYLKKKKILRNSETGTEQVLLWLLISKAEAEQIIAGC